MSKECVFEGEWIMMEFRTPCSIAAPNFAKWARLWNSTRDEFLTRYALMNRSAGAVSFRGFIKLHCGTPGEQREKMCSARRRFFDCWSPALGRNPTQQLISGAAHRKKEARTHSAPLFCFLYFIARQEFHRRLNTFLPAGSSAEFPHVRRKRRESCNLHRNGIKTHARLSLLHLKSE